MKQRKSNHIRRASLRLLASTLLLPFTATAATDVAQMLYRTSFEDTPETADLVNAGGIGAFPITRQNSNTFTYDAMPAGVAITPSARFGDHYFVNFTALGSGAPAWPGISADGGLGPNGKDGFTISYWAYAPTETWNNSSKSQFGFRLGSTNYRVESSSADVKALYLYPADASLGAFNADEWVHVALVVEDGKITCYKNGIASSSETALTGDAPTGNLSQVIIGYAREPASSSWRQYRFNNAFDEVAVFDKPLSAAAIAWLAANQASVPLLRPQITVGEATAFSAAAWLWPAGSNPDAAAPGDLIVMGSGARNLTMNESSTVTGELTVLQSGSSDATSLTIATAGGKLTVEGSTTLRTDTTIEAGAATLGNLTLDPGKTLTVKDPAALAGTVLIPSKATLDLRSVSLPLQGVSELTVKGTICVQSLPAQILPEGIGTLIVDGVDGTVLNAAGESIPFLTRDGWILPPEGLAAWSTPAGIWSTRLWQSASAWTDNATTIFDPVSGGSAVVTVEGTVKPFAMTFQNQATDYTFEGEDGAIQITESSSPLNTVSGGGAVTLNVPLALAGNITLAAGTTLALNRPWGTAPTATAATYNGTLALGQNALLKLNQNAGTIQTISRKFAASNGTGIVIEKTGAGELIISSELRTVFNNGQFRVSDGALTLGGSGSGGEGIFTYSAARTPVIVGTNGVLKLTSTNPLGYNTTYTAGTFAEFATGAKLEAASNPFLLASGLKFKGDNISVAFANTNTANDFRMFPGITLRAEGGKTVFSRNSSSAGYFTIRDGTFAAGANRVIFDIAEGAEIYFNTGLLAHNSSPNGIRKTGAGLLTFGLTALADTLTADVAEGTVALGSSSQAAGTWNITSGGLLRGPGKVVGTKPVNVKTGGKIADITVNNLVLESGAVIQVNANKSTVAASGSLTATGTILIDPTAVPLDTYGKFCDALTWPQGTAPAATFETTGAQARNFHLKTTPTGVELWRVSGIIITLY